MAEEVLSNRQKLEKALQLSLEPHKGKRLDDGLIKQIVTFFGISIFTQEVLRLSATEFDEEVLIRFIAKKRLTNKSAHEIGAAICKQFSKS